MILDNIRNWNYGIWNPNYVWPMGLSFYLTISPLHPPNLKGFPSFSNRLIDVQREGQSRNNSFPLTDVKLFHQPMSANEPSSDKFSNFLWAYEDLYFPGRLTEFWILSLRMYWLNNNQSYSSFFFYLQLIRCTYINFWWYSRSLSYWSYFLCSRNWFHGFLRRL